MRRIAITEYVNDVDFSVYTESGYAVEGPLTEYHSEIADGMYIADQSEIVWPIFKGNVVTLLSKSPSRLWPQTPPQTGRHITVKYPNGKEFDSGQIVATALPESSVLNGAVLHFRPYWSRHTYSVFADDLVTYL
jgi:hypothetical protein